MTAAVVGVIANLALWFGLHVLFGKVGEGAFGPFSIPIPSFVEFDPAAALIAGFAALALIRFHIGVLWVLALAALAGFAIRLFV